MTHMNSITLGNMERRVCSHAYAVCRRSDRLPGGFNVPAGNEIETFCKVKGTERAGFSAAGATPK